MKKILFAILLLAVASLGLALPGKSRVTPSLSAPVSKTPASTTPVSKTPASTTPASKTPASTTPVPTTPASTSPLSTLSSPDALSNALGISQQCSTALLSIVTNPEFLKCIPVAAFLPLIPIVTDPTLLPKLLTDPAGTFKKVEPAFVQFATDFCPAPKCSDDGVNGAIKTITDGCKKELKDNKLIQLVFGLAVFYSPLHDSVCFKDGKKFCWDESLTTIFSLPKSPIKIVDGGLIDSIAVSDPSAVCTRCNKDIFNTFGNFLNGKNSVLPKLILTQLGITDKTLDLVQVGVAVKCGIKFEDGKVPDKH